MPGSSRRNWQPFPVDPATLDAVVLTHAHLDHCGYLPALGRQGLQAPVLATEGTARLAALVLRDSAKLQEEDARYAARGGWSKHTPPLPLDDSQDVERVLPLIRTVAFDEPVPTAARIDLTLRPAGHILGSATALLDTGTVGCSSAATSGAPVTPCSSTRPRRRRPT